MLSQRWNHFLVCSASDEMCSAYEQPGMRYVPRMLSIFWMMFLKWVVISSHAEHARKLVTHWLSTRGNWSLIGWACTEIGYSLTEHTQKLVTLAYVEISFYWYWTMFFPLSSVPLSPFPVPCSMSPVSRVCSLSPILCSLSHVSVPCFPSTVPCITSLFLVSHPLFLVLLLYSLFPALCLSSSVPCLTTLFLVSHPLFPVSLCSLFPALSSLSYISVPCIPSSVPCRPSSVLNFTSYIPCLLFFCSLSPMLSLCSLYPILLSRQFVVLYWFRICSTCNEIVSE